LKATGGTIFKRHTTALDRPGGTLSLRPLQLGGRSSRGRHGGLSEDRPRIRRDSESV